MTKQIMLALVLSAAMFSTGCKTSPTNHTQAEMTSGEAFHAQVRDGEPFDLANIQLEVLGSSRRSPYTEEAIALLEKPVTLKTEGITLGALIEFIRVETAANITVNWAALELVGIDADTRVNLHVTKTPAWKLLELALGEASSDAFDDDRAGFEANEGVVLISTLRDHKKHVVTRLYDVSWYVNNELSMVYQLYDKPPQKDKTDQQGEAGAPLDQDAQLLQGYEGVLCIHWGSESDDYDDYPSRYELIDQVQELIMTSVGDPDEWLDEESTITELNNVFIIRTTRKNHEGIRVLLKALYQSRVHYFEQRARAREAIKLLKDAEHDRMQQSYKDALEHVDQALKVAPDLAEAHVLRTIITGAMRD